MKIPDIFQLNDWQNKEFLLSIFIILMIYDSIFLLNNFLIEIPVLPLLFGFITLTFLPGSICLKLLKVHDLGRLENFVLSIGFSLSFIMVFGFLVNGIFPYFGIAKPISSIPLLFSFNVTICILLIAAYFRDGEYKPSIKWLEIKITLELLSLILLFFIGIFGALLMNYYNLNFFTIIFFFLISIIPICIAFNKIDENYIPLLIFIASLAILYNINLVSMYLWSYDIFPESYGANIVLQNGVWNPQLVQGSPLLLISILAPIYSLLCDLNLIWVFKIIFPFFFAIVPLVLFLIFRHLTFGNNSFDPKLASFSVFIFIYFYGFFKDMPDKQHIAEFFLALLLLLMVVDIPNKNPMAILFSFSLITSHYGVSYLFMFSIIISSVVYYILKKKENKSAFSINFVLLYSAIAVAWYIYIAGGTLFENITTIGEHVLNSLSEILLANARSGVSYLLSATPTTTWILYKIIHIVLQILITGGVVYLLYLLVKGKVKNINFAMIVIAFYFFLVLQITITYGMGFDRVLQITITILSAFAIVGFTLIHSLIHRINFITPNFSSTKIFIGFFLMVFFLFNSGLIFQLSGDSIPPYSIGLNKSAGWPVYDEYEINGVSWLNRQNVKEIWVITHHDALLLNTHYGELLNFYPKLYQKNIPLKILVYVGNSSRTNFEQASEFNRMNQLFVNGRSTIYWKSTN